MNEYISKEELIKALESDFNTDWADYVSNDYIDGVRDEYDDVLKIICAMSAADIQPVNQWISVKDRLPDESCECLGVVDGEVTEVSYSPKQMGYICVWSMCDADGCKALSDDAVTHWMLLPEPPKDGDTNG